MCTVSLANHPRAVADALRLLVFKGQNASATALIWFANDSALIVFIYITSVGKSVHIFIARNIASKSCLMIDS